MIKRLSLFQAKSGLTMRALRFVSLRSQGKRPNVRLPRFEFFLLPN